MPQCVICEEEYSEKRAALGYDTCLACGAVSAAEEAARKAKCVAPAFNKGPIQYITPKTDLKDIGK